MLEPSTAHKFDIRLFLWLALRHLCGIFFIFFLFIAWWLHAIEISIGRLNQIAIEMHAVSHIFYCSSSNITNAWKQYRNAINKPFRYRYLHPALQHCQFLNHLVLTDQ